MKRARRVLVARLDNAGDVVLSGPAARAVAASGAEVHFLCGPRGEEAAGLLPGVTKVWCRRAEWVDHWPQPFDLASMEAWVDLLAAPRVDQLVILTSFHQSPLPLALMAKAAGIPQVAGISVDYPGSLLDLRHRVDDDLHEVHRALSLAEALGYRLPAGDDGRLAVDLGPDGNTGQVVPGPPYVVVHPGASVPARAWSPRRHGEAVAALVRRGRRVVVTGAPGEKDLAGAVIDRARELGTDRASVIDASGSTSLRSLAVVLRGAVAAVVGNTGPAHLAAAVGTPVVSLYAPTVPACRWHPFGVPFRLLGRQDIACAGCRAIECPRPGHPCLATVGASEVAEAVDEVTGLGDHQRRAS